MLPRMPYFVRFRRDARRASGSLFLITNYAHIVLLRPEVFSEYHIVRCFLDLYQDTLFYPALKIPYLELLHAQWILICKSYTRSSPIFITSNTIFTDL